MDPSSRIYIAKSSSAAGGSMQFADLDGRHVSECGAAERLSQNGIILVHQAEESDLLDFLQLWTVIYPHPHANEAGVTVISERPVTMPGTKGFSTAALGLHTDRSTVDHPPSILATLVQTASVVGGELLVADSRPIIAGLLASLPDAGREVLDGAVLASGERTWPLLERKGELVRIRYRDDDMGGPRLEVDSPLRRVLRDIHGSLYSRSFPCGSGYILHNHRYLHGRRDYFGNRTVLRILANVRKENSLEWMNRGFRARTGRDG